VSGILVALGAGGYMRKHPFTFITVLMCFVAVLSTTVSAQSVHLFEIEIPFEFVLHGQTLPAGKYALERIDPAKPNVVMLRNTNRSVARLVLTQRIEKENPSAASYLVFLRREGKTYLFQVWTSGNLNGNQVPLADHNDRGGRVNNNSKLMKLTAKTP
jgi:hypothetical protein